LLYSLFRRFVILLKQELPNADLDDPYAMNVEMLVRLDTGLGH
jgi:hypothetical protein